MAKRWVVQKRLKEKTFRERSRGIMKRYSSEKINGGATPNKEVISWYKNSAKSLGWNTHFQDVVRYNVNTPRAEALKLAEKVSNECSPWMYFQLLDDAFTRARMYFQNNPELCCVVEYDKRRKVIRRSTVFSDRDTAYNRWMDNSIVWVDPDYLYHKRIPETFESERKPTEDSR